MESRPFSQAIKKEASSGCARTSSSRSSWSTKMKMETSENDLAELLASDDGPFLIKVSVMTDQQRVPPPSPPPPPQPTNAPDPRIPPARGRGASPASVHPDDIFQQQSLGAERPVLVEHRVPLQQQLQGYRDHQHEQKDRPEHRCGEKKMKEPQYASGWGGDSAGPPVDAAAVMSVARQYLDQEQRRQALRRRRRSSSASEARESSASSSPAGTAEDGSNVLERLATTSSCNSSSPRAGGGGGGGGDFVTSPPPHRGAGGGDGWRGAFRVGPKVPEVTRGLGHEGPNPWRRGEDVDPVRWLRGDIIGAGAFGTVHLGLNLDTGELMAVKSISLDRGDMTSRDAKAFENETAMLRDNRHENIVKSYGSSIKGNTMFIFLEYMPGGSVRGLLDRFGGFEEHISVLYTEQLMQGLSFLHKNGVAHRDIKCANCLVNQRGAIKLADFGMSKRIVGLSGTSGTSGVQSVKGTPFWMAPEVLQVQDLKDGWIKADVWSLGATVLEMLTGSPPWDNIGPLAAMFKISCTRDLPEIPKSVSPLVQDLLRQCFSRDPSLRPTASELLRHAVVAEVLTTRSLPAFRPAPHKRTTVVPSTAREYAIPSLQLSQRPDHSAISTASSNNTRGSSSKNRGNGNDKHGRSNKITTNHPIGRFTLSVDSTDGMNNNSRAEPHDDYGGMIPTPAAATAGLNGVTATGNNDRDGGRSVASNERGRGHSDASSGSSDCGGSYYRPHQYPIPQQAATPMDLLTSQPPPRTTWSSGGGVLPRAGDAAGWPPAAASAKADLTPTVEEGKESQSGSEVGTRSGSGESTGDSTSTLSFHQQCQQHHQQNRKGSGDAGGGVVTSCSGPSQDGPLSERFSPNPLAVHQRQRNHCGGETVLDWVPANASQEAQGGVGRKGSPDSYTNGSETEWGSARMNDSAMDDASKAGSFARADDNSSPASAMLRACAGAAATEPAPSTASVSSRNPGSGGGGGCETGDRGDETDRRDEPAPERQEDRGGSNGTTGGAAAAVAAKEAVWGGNQAEASLWRPPPLVSGHGEWGWRNGIPLRGGRLPPSRRTSRVEGGAIMAEDSPNSSASLGSGVRNSRDWLNDSRWTNSDTAPSSSHRLESTDTTGSTIRRQKSSEAPRLRLQDSDPSPAVENHSFNSERNHFMVERAQTVLPVDNGARISAAAATASAAPAYTVAAPATGFRGDVHDRRSGGRTRKASYPSLAPRSESGASSSSSKSAIAARASEWKRRIQERGLGAKAEELAAFRHNANLSLGVGSMTSTQIAAVSDFRSSTISSTVIERPRYPTAELDTRRTWTLVAWAAPLTAWIPAVTAA
ncbi:MEKK/MAPK-like [Ectocarpus siliculosus]|uniref:MEKK/MAPK-like n=1 Tax=Ectocarpus siliculosus TaxID=2880 RepID=D8LHC2_ECTSI|nr:MEKK/MAPK-like [Ectocarpus siliculosus]|eukprot:CBN74341.1 MEKK/MAPK-like [Ectocarpus siliculosus]